MSFFGKVKSFFSGSSEEGGHAAPHDKGVLESIWDGGAKFVEGVASPAASLLAHGNPAVMGYSIGKSLLHLGHAGYDAVTGDRHGAIEHVTEGGLGLAGLSPIGKALHAVEGLYNGAVGTSSYINNDMEGKQTFGEKIGGGINHLIDGVVGKSEHHDKTAGESDGGISGALIGGLSPLSFALGPIGAVMAGKAMGSWLGKKISGETTVSGEAT